MVGVEGLLRELTVRGLVKVVGSIDSVHGGESGRAGRARRGELVVRM